jgi:short-subunit dehydrogenase
VELRGANAFLTGAAGGLGAYIARALAAEGVSLVLSDLPDAGLDPLVDELTAGGVKVEVVAADLADRQERQGLFDRAEEALGPIDILVNNAGVEFASPFTDATPEQIDLITAVNLAAVMELTRQALPAMLERGRGHIVNLASMAGKTAAPFLATYSGTKHGVVGFSHSLRTEIGPEPVGISAICPIFISRVGMYGRLEDELPEPPPELATLPPEAVGEAVVKAVRENRAEVLVAKGPTRPLIFLYAVAPQLTSRLVRRRRRVLEFARDFAEVRRRKEERGSPSATGRGA